MDWRGCRQGQKHKNRSDLQTLFRNHKDEALHRNAESFRAFLSFSGSPHFTDATVELRALPLPGGFAAFFAHLREVVCAILRHVGRAALSSDGAVVFTATFFFK